MMIEPRSTATIRALASLAELSANQLEDGVDVEQVIATLRKAAEAVRLVVDVEDAFDDEDDNFETGTLEASDDTEETDAPEETDIVQDLTPMDLAEEDADNKIVALDRKDAEELAKEEEVTVLNAG
ncbi:hypothetical protein [Roseibium sp. M-1]